MFKNIGCQPCLNIHLRSCHIQTTFRNSRRLNPSMVSTQTMAPHPGTSPLTFWAFPKVNPTTTRAHTFPKQQRQYVAPTWLDSYLGSTWWYALGLVPRHPQNAWNPKMATSIYIYDTSISKEFSFTPIDLGCSSVFLGGYSEISRVKSFTCRWFANLSFLSNQQKWEIHHHQVLRTTTKVRS